MRQTADLLEQRRVECLNVLRTIDRAGTTEVLNNFGRTVQLEELLNVWDAGPAISPLANDDTVSADSGTHSGSNNTFPASQPDRSEKPCGFGSGILNIIRRDKKLPI